MCRNFIYQDGLYTIVILYFDIFLRTIVRNEISFVNANAAKFSGSREHCFRLCTFDPPWMDIVEDLAL